MGVDGLEVCRVRTEGASGTVESNGRRLLGNDGLLVMSQSKEMAQQIVDIVLALDDSGRGEKGSQPTNRGSRQAVERRKTRSDLEFDLEVALFNFDAILLAVKVRLPCRTP